MRILVESMRVHLILTASLLLTLMVHASRGDQPDVSGAPQQAIDDDIQNSLAYWIQDLGSGSDIMPTQFESSAGVVEGVPTSPDPANEAQRFAGRFSTSDARFDVGSDLYSPPDFEGGLIVIGEDVALKIGGYVKADFIYDLDPIDSTDSFDTTQIPVGAPPRTNARYHARQTRLSFDTRWVSGQHTVKVFVEGDFFSDQDRFRLRHAYGEVGQFLVGQTWTTFADVSASPATLDFEGSVSSINRRQAQARWTQSLLHEDLTLALAVEDTRFIIIPPPNITGDSRSPSPDFVARWRLEKDWGKFQLAQLYRIGGFQETDGEVATVSAWGTNISGVILLTESSKVYGQLVFGDGIGSYRGLPDAAPESASTNRLLGMFGWMAGITLDWTENLSSNFTYAENELDNASMQLPDDVHRTTYLAANLIWSPITRVQVGIEFLHGLRENVDGGIGEANRAQFAFIFNLP